MKKTILLLLCSFFVLSLVACGRKSKPEAPKDSFYPHTYIIKSDTE